VIFYHQQIANLTVEEFTERLNCPVVNAIKVVVIEAANGGSGYPRSLSEIALGQPIALGALSVLDIPLIDEDRETADHFFAHSTILFFSPRVSQIVSLKH
jgi:hypothetical protein